MCGLPPRGDCRESVKVLQVMTVCLIYVKENYCSFFEHSMSHSYNTREEDSLVTNFYCYARIQKTFLGVFIKLFNS